MMHAIGEQVKGQQGRQIVVNVQGHEYTVTVKKHGSLAAVTTDARWQAGCGSEPADNWEIRDETGRLLSPTWPSSYWFPAKVFVNLPAGIGA